MKKFVDLVFIYNAVVAHAQTHAKTNTYDKAFDLCTFWPTDGQVLGVTYHTGSYHLYDSYYSIQSHTIVVRISSDPCLYLVCLSVCLCITAVSLSGCCLVLLAIYSL